MKTAVLPVHFPFFLSLFHNGSKPPQQQHLQQHLQLTRLSLSDKENRIHIYSLHVWMIIQMSQLSLYEKLMGAYNRARYSYSCIQFQVYLRGSRMFDYKISGSLKICVSILYCFIISILQLLRSLTSLHWQRKGRVVLF